MVIFLIPAVLGSYYLPTKLFRVVAALIILILSSLSSLWASQSIDFYFSENTYWTDMALACLFLIDSLTDKRSISIFGAIFFVILSISSNVLLLPLWGFFALSWLFWVFCNKEASELDVLPIIATLFLFEMNNKVLGSIYDIENFLNYSYIPGHEMLMKATGVISLLVFTYFIPRNKNIFYLIPLFAIIDKVKVQLLLSDMDYIYISLLIVTFTFAKSIFRKEKVNLWPISFLMGFTSHPAFIFLPFIEPGYEAIREYLHTRISGKFDISSYFSLLVTTIVSIAILALFKLQLGLVLTILLFFNLVLLLSQIELDRKMRLQ